MQQDFEQAWLGKLAAGLDSIVGEQLRAEVMQGRESLSADRGPEASTDWTRLLMARMNTMLGQEKAREVMTRCACEYPKTSLNPIRQEFERTGDVGSAIRMLQSGFESFLRENLKLSDELADRVIALGWGVAGRLEGNTIISTKIPKSGNLVKYFSETDPAIKQQLYCHCPRMQHALRTSGKMPLLYCYCGAGFYRGIWEEILQRPVQVEVLETVLDGGDVCRIAIHLPSGT